jgi:hypothetical protein
MTQLVVALRRFAKAPRNVVIYQNLCESDCITLLVRVHSFTPRLSSKIVYISGPVLRSKACDTDRIFRAKHLYLQCERCLN